LGNEIKTLIAEEKIAGVYSLSLTVETINSGIYFYTLRSQGFSLTRKMIVLK
jgi:hypothetical protein